MRTSEQHLPDRHRRLSRGRDRLRVWTLIDPRVYFNSFNTRIHGITADYVAGKPCLGDLHQIIDGHLAGRVTVAHSYFDTRALTAACRVHDRAPIEALWLDGVRIAKRVYPDLPSHRLNVVHLAGEHSGPHWHPYVIDDLHMEWPQRN